MIVEKHLTYKTIKTPKTNRREVLNVAINLIDLMQQQKRIKEIRDQKHKIMLMLKDEVKTTNNLISNFENILPQAKIRKEKKKKQIKIITKKQVITEGPSKIDSLHQELFNLKSKLDNL